MTETKLKRRLVNVDFYPSDVESRASRGANGRVYNGRLIGLINDKEFAAIIANKELQKKCYTSGTMSLSDIVDHHEKLDGYRMVIAIRKVDNNNVIGNKLLITERLSLVSYLDKDKTAGITGENGAYMMVEEVQE